MDIEVPKRDGVTYRCIPVGWDGFLFAVMPSAWFAKRVVRKLRAHGRFANWIALPDGTEWDSEGRPAPKTEGANK